ncbi:hypothetical protein [Streptomyces sp. NPDC094049]|uniref:hypothetical protein n=1 Tax=Streptomyces sp. NPDC094049 TaxID=3154987 RepID=UPI00331834E9
MPKAIALAAASLGLLATLGTAPAASAATSDGTGAAACDSNWSYSNSWGRASGKFCDNVTGMVGTVTDTAADGRCPYVRGNLNNGSWRDSDWAGPKGDSSPVNIWAPAGTYFVSWQLLAIYC